MKVFANKHIAVYVTGSVACYKTLTLLRLLNKQGASVRVIMSHGAQRFIKPLIFQAISGQHVITDQNLGKSSHGILHVDLARWTDVAIVMPATANVIAKLANGIADDVVTTCLLATASPKVIVPAMNSLMFKNPATQRNLTILSKYSGYYQFGPAYGKLAEGYSGKGRMVEPQYVVNRLKKMFNNYYPLDNLNVIVTAGGTREAIDPIRFITNGSTGKMGYAIAQRAQELGANVTLISGHAEVPVPKGVKLIRVKTTEDMKNAVLKWFPKAQVLIMAAALADFEPIHYSNEKIKKAKSNQHELILKLKKSPDVLSNVAKIKQPGQITVGFAAETQDLIKNATRKLISKQLDLIVANDVSKAKIGFGTDDNQVTFINSQGHQKKTPIESKRKIADRLLMIIDKLKDDRS